MARKYAPQRRCLCLFRRSGKCDGFPAIARTDRSIRPKTVAERRELLRRRRGIDSPGQAVALTDAEIVDRPDIEPAQLEHQIHLCGPPADPSYRGKFGDDFLVIAPGQLLEIDLTARGLRCQ